MKTPLIPTLLFSLASVIPCVHAADVQSKIDSTYTSLGITDCQIREENANEGWSKSVCPGVADYKLNLTEGDLRQSLDVVDPQGKVHPLNFSSTVSGGFSALGQKAEWRVQKKAGKTLPIAMIVRFNVSEDPVHSEKTTSYLVVSKITPTSICVTDVVKPSKTANQQARDLADTAATRECKKVS
ncbi:MAG: hypothetical protein RI964_1117 [Pseudomonadota bacterium]|jgi:hypothetical protein